MAEYSKESPYYQTLQRSFYLDLWQPRQIESSDSDTIVKIEQKHKERPDILSYELYGTTGYWWVFAIRNMDTIKDPVFDFQPGVEIYVPSLESLKGSLS